MQKSILSHEQNYYTQKHLSVIKAQEVIGNSPIPKMLDPKILPFFEDWKSTSLEHIVDTSSDFSEVLTAQEQLYLKKAAFYNIELNNNQWCELTDLHMFDAVDSWEKKLKEALFLGVNWRMNDYDPDDLEYAIEAKEEACDIEARSERRQANAYYYSTRGC